MAPHVMARRGAQAVNPSRSFDPRRVGRLEFQTWVSYYRREWWSFLRAAVAVTRHAFGLPWPSTLYAAWLVLRANQVWAPYPDNRPDAARAFMRRFYRLLARVHGESFDVDEAARLEVEWWRVHRELQHAPGGAVAAQRRDGPEDELVEAITRLYAHVYAVPAAQVRQAAHERALAMVVSDAWVAQGCLLNSPLLPREQACLIRSYAALLAAVHRPPGEDGTTGLISSAQDGA